MAWIPIVNAEIDPDSPITTGLKTKYRDNDEAMYNASIYARKAAPTVRNLAGVIDDPHLTVTPVINSIYMVEILVWVTTANAAADFQYDFTTPGGSTFDIGVMGGVGGAGGAPGAFYTDTGTPGSFDFPAARTKLPFLFKGTLRTAGAAGTFALQWDSVGAGNTTLATDSYLHLQQPYSDI